MSDTNLIVVCPKCNNKISIDDALKSQIMGDTEREYSAKLEEEKKKMWAIAQKKAEEKIKLESEQNTKILKEELEIKSKKLEAAEKSELELRRSKLQLEEEKKSFELEKQRQLDIERAKIKEEAQKAYAEEHKYKDAEKDKVIADMRKQVEDLKRKSDLSSQQLQGEVLELDLEESLRSEFPIDEIAPVPKGINGADIVHKVKTKQGAAAGIITWELKRTKAWTEGWIQKLKEDQRAVKADLAVLISAVLPDDVEGFGFRDGVYIAKPKYALSIARVLRLDILRVANLKSTEAGKNEKKEVLYNYLCGSEFRGRVEAIIEASIAAKKALDQEKRAYNKIWAIREKQIEKIELNMIGMWGDMQGIAGQSLPEIKSLELSSGEEELEAIIDGEKNNNANDQVGLGF